MIYQTFSKNLLSTPDAPAVVTSSGKTYSYLSANLLVHQWAHYLTMQGVSPDDRVAVLLDNEDHHVFILLALDRINACYVPFEADTPKLQLAAEIEELGLKKFIIEDALILEFNIPDKIKLTLSATELVIIYSSSTESPPVPYNTDNEKIVYIVPSSGSKKRKLIPALGRGLSDYWSPVLTDLSKKDPFGNVLATRNPAWDARIFEYLLAFNNGGALYLLNRFQRRDWVSILTTCEKSPINCLLIIASQLNAGNCANIVPKLASFGVKHLMVTGDACSFELKTICERENVKLWNGYGPTEGPIGLSLLCVNDIHLKDSTDRPVMPIGKPHGYGVHTHIDEDGKLLIESPFLSPGYINPDDNEGNFISKLTEQGETIRLFATGDYFSEHESGYLIFQGRDGFCKIDSVKIFPQDIEGKLLEYNQHSSDSPIQATVVIKEHLGVTKFFAYLILNPDFKQAAFLAYLKKVMTNQEIPTLVTIDAFPRLNGKINRKALVALEDKHENFLFYKKQEPINSQPSIAKTDYHQHVKQIWCELLEHDDLPTDVGFSFLGGTSSLMSLMMTKIREHLAPTYTYEALLRLQEITIDNVANSIFKQNPAILEQSFVQLLIKSSAKKSNLFLTPALLGEGFFSYQELAKHLAKKFDTNIYGLSDPGIIDEALLPTSMAHAVERYIRAIKSVQPRGPYHLCGFSFGATLAYEITKQLMQDGEEVIELHLLDGYPPLLFQTLPDTAYANLLQALIDFIIVTLNNDYYAEHLTPIKLDDYSKLNKVQQVEHSFRELELRLSKPASKNLLGIAKCHLLFLLQAKEPDKKLFGVWPILYLTNEQHPYLNVIKEVPHLSKESVGHQYYLWSEYFENVTRSCRVLQGDHLSVLGSDFSEEKYDPSYFWNRDPKWFSPIKHASDFSIQSFYHLTPIDAAPDCDQMLSVFFIPRFFAYFFASQLSAMQLSPRVTCHDLNFQSSFRESMDENDSSFSSQATIFCVVPFGKINSVSSLLKEQNIYMSCVYREAPRKILPSLKQELMMKQSGEIDLVILWNHTVLLTKSFKYCSLPSLIIDELQQLGFSSAVSIDKTNIIYHHKMEAALGSLRDALISVENFLADFISILARHVAEDISLEFCAEKRFRALLCQEMTHYLSAFSAEADPITFKELTTLPSKWPYYRCYRYCPTRKDELIFKESKYNTQVPLRLCYHHCAEVIGKKVLGLISEKMLKEFSSLYPNEISLQKSRFFKSWKFYVPWFEIEEFAIKENILALLTITPDVVEKTLNRADGIFRKERSASIRSSTFSSLWYLNRGFFASNLGDLPRGEALPTIAPAALPAAIHHPIAPALMEI
jgi:acyl-CoA synthetase (AMP-forming)/AMP-acid ligase II